MAEERIGITKFKETETPDFELCAYHLITRSEAIEKMAKAMIKRYNSERTLTKWEKEWDKKHPKEAYKYFYIDAEKALNALLGEK